MMVFNNEDSKNESPNVPSQDDALREHNPKQEEGQQQQKETESNKTEVVSTLRRQITDLQRQLLATVIDPSFSSPGVDKDGGCARVEFVRVKPSSWSCLTSGGCKKGATMKTILHSFHVDFPEGCVTVLMGPSGAGKTTLLDFVTGMLGRSVLARGEVSLPDNDAYVPQDDRLHSFYTCQTYMEHYARLSGLKPLCCGCGSKERSSESASCGDEEDANPEYNVDEHIASILKGVGLTNQKDTVVGGLLQRGLSGGQKRRLSVALEALSSPLNLFLDEPTSGLDSESALRLMQYLKEYASSECPITGLGRRVILTIHQPSSFIWELVDNVILLAEGRLMYQGPRIQMEDFFTASGHPTPINFNPADHYIQATFQPPSSADGERGENSDVKGSLPLTNNISELWSNCFKEWNEEKSSSPTRESKTSKHSVTDNNMASVIVRRDPTKASTAADNAVDAVNAAHAKSSKWTRIAVELTRRYFVNLAKNPGILGLRIIIYVGLALVLGILFFNLESDESMHAVAMSRAALLYFIVAFFTSMAVAVVPFALTERAIVQKEVRNHRFHPAFYQASQALASVPGCFILALLTTVIIMGMTKMRGPLAFGINLFLLLNCAEALAQLMAHIATDFIAALALLSGVFGVFTLLMGFLVIPSQFPSWLQWSYYVPCMTYSFRSMMYNEYAGQEFDANPLMQCYDEKVVPLLGNRTVAQQLPAAQFLELQQEVSAECDLPDYSGGDKILEIYEMSNVDIFRDMMTLILWAFIVHMISLAYLHYSWLRNKRIFVYADEH